MEIKLREKVMRKKWILYKKEITWQGELANENELISLNPTHGPRSGGAETKKQS